MRLFVGTSGYSYKEWKGSFYPEKLPSKEMLTYYSQRFAAVEINSSFRALPEPNVIASWTQQAPAGFRFVLKAPQAISHFKRLKNAENETRDLVRTAAALKRRRGPVLFQLPPNFKKDLPRLKSFMSLLGRRAYAAFEFRHQSWFDDDVFDCLRQRACALCAADTDDLPFGDLINTAGWGYMRLRRKRYTVKQLRQWIDKIKSQPWNEAYVFFKHEDTGTGPRLAARFLELAAGTL